MNVTPLARTLDQELVALIRGASLACPCAPSSSSRCAHGLVACPECRSLLVEGHEMPELELPSVVQAG